jgi:hypothetical protein
LRSLRRKEEVKCSSPAKQRGGGRACSNPGQHRGTPSAASQPKSTDMRASKG